MKEKYISCLKKVCNNTKMDNNNLKEKNFEEDIERWLLDEGGYERGFQITR